MVFKIKINAEYSLDYPTGYIIAQSLSPGDVVNFGQKLQLLVNTSIAIIEMPNLIGINENSVPRLLQDIRVGKRLFNLPLATITKVTSERPAGEVLAQFPPAKTPVQPDTPVSILVSKGDTDKDTDESPLNLNGLNIEIIKRYAYYKNIPLTIETKNVDDIKSNAVVIKSKFINTPKEWEIKDQQILSVTVGRFQDKSLDKIVEMNYPYHFVWLNDDNLNIDEGLYTIGNIFTERKKEIKKENSIKYIPYGLIYFKEDVTIPVFLAPNETIYFWENKVKIHNKNLILTLDENNIDEENLLLKEDIQEEKEETKIVIPSPDDEITLKSFTL